MYKFNIFPVINVIHYILQQKEGKVARWKKDRYTYTFMTIWIRFNPLHPVDFYSTTAGVVVHSISIKDTYISRGIM